MPSTLPLPVLQDLVLAKLNTECAERLALPGWHLDLLNAHVRLVVAACRCIEAEHALASLATGLQGPHPIPDVC